MNDAQFSTMALPDGVVIGGPWPDTIITWPAPTIAAPDGDGRGAPRWRRATKPEYDLYQALEREHARAEEHERASVALNRLMDTIRKERDVYFSRLCKYEVPPTPNEMRAP